MKNLEKLNDDELNKIIQSIEKERLEKKNFIDNSNNYQKIYLSQLKEIIEQIKIMNDFFSSKAQFSEISIGLIFKDKKHELEMSFANQKKYFSMFEDLLRIYSKLRKLSSNLSSLNNFDLSKEIIELNIVPKAVGRFGSDKISVGDQLNNYGNGFITTLPLIPNPKEQTHLGTGENSFGPEAMAFFHELLFILFTELEEKEGDLSFYYKKKITKFTGARFSILVSFMNNIRQGYYNITTEIIQDKLSYMKKYNGFLEDTEKQLRKIELILRARKKGKEKIENVGYVYVLSNQSLPPNTYKIGSTYGLPEERAEDLTGTGHLTPFKVVNKIKIQSAEYYEKNIHSLLKNYRVKQNREFFEIDLNKIKNCLKQVSEISEKGSKKITLADLKKEIIL